MFRLWAKIWKDNRMMKDTVVCDESDLRRTQKVFAAIEQVAEEFDLSRPIWLEKNIKEFQNHNRARFYQDNFAETIEFDYLEVQVIEEDDFY